MISDARCSLLLRRIATAHVGLAPCHLGGASSWHYSGRSRGKWSSAPPVHACRESGRTSPGSQLCCRPPPHPHADQPPNHTHYPHLPWCCRLRWPRRPGRRRRRPGGEPQKRRRGGGRRSGSGGEPRGTTAAAGRGEGFCVLYVCCTWEGGGAAAVVNRTALLPGRLWVGEVSCFVVAVHGWEEER